MNPLPQRRGACTLSVKADSLVRWWLTFKIKLLLFGYQVNILLTAKSELQTVTTAKAVVSLRQNADGKFCVAEFLTSVYSGVNAKLIYFLAQTSV